MNAPDIKKLVTGFLVLAFIASTSTALFSGLFSNAESTPAKDSSQTAKNLQVASANGFIETIPAASESNELPQLTTGNLTDYTSAALARQILNENPNGPIIENGVPQIATPDLEKVADDLLANSSAIADFAAVPDLDQLLPKPSKVVDKYSSNDVILFLRNFNEALNNGILSQEFSSILDADPTADSVNALSVVVSQTIVSLQKFPVPAPLVPLYEATLRPFIGLREGLSALQNGTSDPMKALGLLELRSNQIMQVAADIKVQADLLRFTTSTAESSENKNMGGIFKKFIPTAQAQAEVVSVPISCVGGTCIPTLTQAAITAKATAALTLWERIIKFGKTLAREILKDRIIHNLVAQTVKWIQGGGKPQFVTDWKGFLRDAADIAAGDAIQGIAPGFCKSFGPLVRLQLESVYLSNPSVSCTLEQVVENVKDFYNSFSNGGWIAFGQTALPSGNYFGQLFEGSQIVAQRAEAAKDAAQNDAIASGGFLSTEICTEIKVINEYKDCLDTVQAEGGDPAECNADENRDVKQCVKREQTTPGSALGHTVYDALGAPIQRIVNADDIIALTSAVANALITKLIAFGNDRLNNTGLAGVKVSTTTISSDPSKSPCYGLAGTAFNECIASITGTCSTFTGAERNDCINIMCNGLTGTNLTQCKAAVIATTSGEDGENCNGGSAGPCNCRGRDNLTDANFCFVDQVRVVIDQIKTEWLADPTLDFGLEGRGLCDAEVCVSGDGTKFASEVKKRLEAQGLTVGDVSPNIEELAVTGACNKEPVCGAAGCISGSPRTENYKLVSSFHTIQLNNMARAVCPVTP